MPNTKKIWFYSLSTLACLMSFSCVKIIDIDVPKVETMLVVDALINNKSEPQVITLSQTRPLFTKDTSVLYALNAEVNIKDEQGNKYHFTALFEGWYYWTPQNGEALGLEGDVYTLEIKWEGQTYQATSQISRVPPIVDFIQKNDSLFEFFATDLSGVGDFYLVQSIEITEIITPPYGFSETPRQHGGILYDASFLQGSHSSLDGIDFLPSVRQLIILTSKDYSSKTTLHVELHAITREATLFLKDIDDQFAQSHTSDDDSDAEHIFPALFSGPPFNVYSNIHNVDPAGKPAIGLFCVANVSSSKSINLN